MPPEEYIESIIIRRDNVHSDNDMPMLDDEDLDEVFEFEGTVQLMQIMKSVQNKTHNRHDYVFKIINITKLEKENQ